MLPGSRARLSTAPLAEEEAETAIIASSIEQGRKAVFRRVQRFLRPKLESEGTGRNGRWRVEDSSNRACIQDRKTGAAVRVLGSDPKRLHGGAPKLLILDELAQWPGHFIDEMLAALSTSLGKLEGSCALWIGTRAASPEHRFERALAGGLDFAQVHSASKGDNPFHRRTWKKANPGL